MTLVLGIDLETSGIDPSKDKILEIGCVLWDIESQQPVKQWSVLVNDFQDEIYLTELNKLVHGLTEEMIERHGYPLSKAVVVLKSFFKEATYIVAHNSSFEQGFIYAIPEMQEFLDKPWIDTLFDVPYPLTMTSRNLTALATAHGLLNPFPHRALSDVLMMLQIMSRYNFDEIVKLSTEETFKIKCFAADDEERGAAKKLGFFFSKPEKAFMADIKASREVEFKEWVLKVFPEAFTEPPVRLIANVPFEKKDLAKNLDYNFLNDGMRKIWYKRVRPQQIQKELDAAQGKFSVDIEYPSLPLNNDEGVDLSLFVIDEQLANQVMSTSSESEVIPLQ